MSLPDDFLYKWDVPKFNCYYQGKYNVSTKFNIGDNDNKPKFIGNLSLTGDSCGKRICKLTVQSSTYSVWNIYVKLYVDQLQTNQQKISSVPLNKIDNVTELKFQYNGSCIGCLLASRIIICGVRFGICKKLKPTIRPMEQFTLTNNLLELMKSQKCWDVTLFVDGHEMHAHKGILASRSKVLAARFEEEMEEVQTNKVTISDTKFEVFEQILLYMYTDTVEKLNEMSAELLAASEKYDLQNLKRRCENTLIENLHIANAAETLILADLHSAENLKEYTIDFIAANSKDVANTEGFKMIKDNMNSHLLLELYLKIVK